MLRIDTPNRALDLFGAGKDGFRDGNKVAGINATEFDAAFCNAIQEELAGVIEGAGITLNPASNAQLLAAVHALIEARVGDFALDTGAANAYVMALNPTIAAYTGDFDFAIKIANAPTGASTINFGGGAVPLVNDQGGAIVANDFAPGSVLRGQYIHADGKAYITSLVTSQALSQTTADLRYPLKTQVAQAAPVAVVNSASATSVSATTANFIAPSNGRLLIFMFGSSFGTTPSAINLAASLGPLTTTATDMLSNTFGIYAASLEMVAGQSTTVTGTYNSSDASSKFVLVQTFFLPGV
jgi:hypothetical protein